MTKARRIAALILSLIMVLSLCVMFASCVNEEELQQKQQRIDELQAQLEGKQKEIEDLKAQLESKQKELDELQRENETSTFQLNNAKKDIKNLVGQLSELVTPDLETLTKEEEYIIQHGREPSLKYDFKDNTVNVIIKRSFLGLVGFNDFKVTKSVSEVIAITCGEETIYKGSNDTFPFYEGHNKGITLTLATHDKAKVLEVIDILRKLDIVLIADPDYNSIAVPLSVPSDTNYSAQWGLNGNYGINVEEAWNYTKGDYSVKVGVMEGSFDGHEDLGNMFNANITEWSTDSGEAQNRINHGTHVAGIIGANMDNNLGIAGVAKCSMYMLNPGNLIDSLKYAAENGIKVINASFYFVDDVGGTLIPSPFNQKHYDAIAEYGKRGGLLICAAGNDGHSNDYTPVYPASYDLPNVISVGSIDSDGDISDFSNYGKQSVDIFAPGGNILSTFPKHSCNGVILSTTDGREFYECETNLIEYPDGSGELVRVRNNTTHYQNGYHYMSGTSMAAPFVTGVAALLLANNPALNPQDIKATILGNVDKSDNLTNLCVSGGRLNAYNALRNPIHSYVYEIIGQGQHRATCECGSIIVGYHTGHFTSLGTTSGHSGYCTVCGFSGSEWHVWERLAVSFKCKVCRAVSRYIEVTFPGDNDVGIYGIQNASMSNGQTFIVDDAVILFYENKYYLLIDGLENYETDDIVFNAADLVLSRLSFLAGHCPRE